MGFTEQQPSRILMRTRRNVTPLSILFSMFLLLLIIGVSVVSFIEICIIYIWDNIADKCKSHLKI
jgi:hypothetical protein